MQQEGLWDLSWEAVLAGLTAQHPCAWQALSDHLEKGACGFLQQVLKCHPCPNSTDARLPLPILTAQALHPQRHWQPAPILTRGQQQQAQLLLQPQHLPQALPHSGTS